VTSLEVSKHAAVLKSLLSSYFASAMLLSRDGMHYRTLKTKIMVRTHPSRVLVAEEMRLKLVIC
jgi:hypothetical protein